jgi:hypothetical protein
MASYTPPSENLPIFDNSVFTTTTSSSGGFTYDELVALFLTYPVAQGEQTIASLISNEIDTDLPTSTFNFLDSITTGTVNMFNSQSTGILNIGNRVNRTGAINIGTNMQETITIGNTGGLVNINGTGTIKASSFDTGSVGVGVSLYTSTTTGSFTMLTGQTSGTINIATNGSRSGAINIGSASCTLNITGTGTLKANKFDATLEGTDVTICETTGSGDIDFASNQSGGPLRIGTKATRTGGITIGAETCPVNVTGIGTIKANTFDVVGSGTNVTILDTSTTGTINIASNASRTGTITMGSTGCVTNITGIGTIKADIFDIVGSGTNGTLFNTTTTGNIGIGSSQVGGVFNIANNASRSGAITMGSTGCVTNITGTGTIKANAFDVVGSGTNVTLFNTTTTGTIGIGNNQTNDILSIGTLGARTGAINIGVAGCAVNITGTGTIKANSFDVVSNGTAVTLFNTTTGGTIGIGSSQVGGTFNIANSATRTGTITMGSTGCATNITGIGTIKANAFDIVGASTNTSLFTSTVGGAINIGTNQVGGTCEIATSATRTGPLYINSTTGATNSIFIGTGGTTMTLDSATLSVGSTNTTTLNIGTTSTTTLAIRGAAQLTSALRLPIANTTPTTTQLGYNLSSAITGPSVAISTATGLLAVTNVAIGIYILTYDVNVDTITSGTGATLTFTFPVTGSATVSQVSSSLGGITNGQSTGASYTGVLKCTTATNNVTLTMACNVGTAIARTYKSTIIKIG